MTEKQITICGHGSNTPSTKNLYEYLETRYTSYCTNSGRTIRKELKAVRRLKALKDPTKFHDTYKGILGRNVYNQSLRSYCYKAYTDGKYYSDCSSSGCLTFAQIGLACPTYNCAGIYNSELFEEVAVKIVNGHITNPEVLQVGDALLFAGSTAGRPLDISHVEYIYEISGATTTTPAKAETYPKWVKSGNDWYYRIAAGKNAHGWKVINGHKYYFDSKGKAVTGLQTISGKQYFFATKDISTDYECALMDFVTS